MEEHNQFPVEQVAKLYSRFLAAKRYLNDDYNKYNADASDLIKAFDEFLPYKELYVELRNSSETFLVNIKDGEIPFMVEIQQD